MDAPNTGAHIPVTLPSGLLSSGKTTVLKHLLKQPELGNAAVLINEFGEIGLDRDLVEAVTENLALLQNRRLCCTIRGDLVIENGFFYDCARAWDRDAAKALHRGWKLREHQPKRGNQALGRRDATRSIQSAMLAGELTIHTKPVREGTPMTA